MAYLTLATLKARTLAPPEYLDTIEAAEPGWIDTMLGSVSAWIDARLRKRYAAPFEDPPPAAVLDWANVIATLQVYWKRGVNPNDEQVVLMRELAATAKEEIKEAADAKDGLFDLPLRSDTTADGIINAGPLAYSEASPYQWIDAQAIAIDGVWNS